jgi:MoxR-like ATPase
MNTDYSDLSHEVNKESESFNETIQKLNVMKQEISKVVVGQPEVLNQILASFLAAGHILLEGVPGLGKTLLVKALAKTFSGSFSRIQFTPDLMPADVMGHAMFNMKSQEFIVRKGPVFTNLLLADEINRAPAKTQSSLLEVMQELQVTIEGESHKVEPPFMVLATQNPLEQEGTYPLPEAQLDRFLLKITMDYPNEVDEVSLVKQVTSGQSQEKLDVDLMESVISPSEVEKMRELTASLSIDDQVLEYAVKIVRSTRDWPGIAIGAGSRGALALVRVAKASALLNNRQFVIPDDIKSMVLPTLRHRIALTPEMEIEGLSPDSVLTELVNKIPAPRV